MGALFSLIVRGLVYAGPAAIGYFLNDIGEFFAGLFNRMFPDKSVRDSSGGFSWWFLLPVLAIAGAVFLFVTKMFTGKKKIFTLLMLAAFGLDYAAGAPSVSLVTASLLFSIAASSTETKSVAYCPEYIAFTIATVPTSLKIEALGDGVVFSLDGTGLTNLNGIRLVGALPANTYVFHIADGFVKKNTNFTIENAQAAQLDVYGWSDSPGENFVVHESAKAFANQDNDVPPFLYSAFPSAAAADLFTITWVNPRTRKVTNNTMTRMELEAYLAQVQDVAATRYNIDNFAGRIVSVQFRPSADQSYYFTRPQRVR